MSNSYSLWHIPKHVWMEMANRELTEEQKENIRKLKSLNEEDRKAIEFERAAREKSLKKTYTWYCGSIVLGD